jgi:hypothetical protein
MANTTTEHFAVGLTAFIKHGAKPVGWDEDSMGEFEDGQYVWERWRPITEVAEGEPGFPYGSYEVAGWYWSPTDLTVQ